LGKSTFKKQTKSKPDGKGAARFTRPVLALGIPVGVVVFYLLQIAGPASPDYLDQHIRAAIIDQIYNRQPNEGFISDVTRELEEYGFEVDLYQGDEVTVDLYRRLPTYGYKLIVFRVHSGSLVGEVGTNITWLFTNEPYSTTRYLGEQLTDQVTFASTGQNAPYVFAVSPEFITSSMEGEFCNTAVIMMGCCCLRLDDLAQSFIEKGASAYIGWDVSVRLDYVDDATPVLVESLCSDGFTVTEAVDRTMREKGPDPEHGAILEYYPRIDTKKTLRQLIE